MVRLDEAGARGLAARLESASFAVRSVEERPWRRTPHAPFMTSTLQQEAGRKLRFSAARTMRVAQDLYEAGYITYMRTDSTTLSDEALQRGPVARPAALYGDAYVPEQPRRYDKKVKNAQEAHEAIRPAGDTFRTPDRPACTATSAACTSWCGCGRWRPRWPTPSARAWWSGSGASRRPARTPSSAPAAG